MRLPIGNLRTFPIGRKEDGGVQIVEIDCTLWRTKYPQLTDYRLEVTDPSGLVYLPVIEMRGDILVWEIKQSDTVHRGKGEYQVVATGADGVQKKSAHPPYFVLSTMEGTAGETPPAPSQSWVNRVVEAEKNAKASADRAERIANDISGGVIHGAVRYDTAMELTDEEKAQARANIGADGVRFTTDKTLSLDPETGVLSVNTADKVEADNTLPVTAAAVQTTVGNINALLSTI